MKKFTILLGLMFVASISFVFAQNEKVKNLGFPTEVQNSLSETAIKSITGIMDGGFETNVNDFDLEFPGWTQHDVDGSSTYGFLGISFTNAYYTGSFIAFNPANTNPSMADQPAIQPHSGNRFGACFAATTPPNNDWLITPQTNVLSSGANVKFWVKSYTADYGLERYAVWVSTTTTDISAFTKISEGNYLTAPATWEEKTFDLSDYAGQQVYIGIQCVSSDAFIFMIDDIVVSDGFVSINDIEINDINIYPNPASDFVTVSNAENAEITIINMLGQVVTSQFANSSCEIVNISNLTNGTYIIRVENDNKVITKKLNVFR
ncbi:MAG: choice-of-anchor J domain-containing protein [Bacteroidales bacterium]